MDKNDESEVNQAVAEQFSTCRADTDWQPNLQHGLMILRERRAMKNLRRRRLTLVITGAVAACLPLMAFPVGRAFAQRCVSACVQETAAVSQFLLGRSSLAAPGSTFVKPADRRKAPDFTFADPTGRQVSLSDFHGKVVLLNFWATWCRPCDQEIPWFVEFQSLNSERGFSVLGVSMDEEGWTAVNPYIREKRVNYPVTIGNSEIAGLFGGLKSIPLTVIIDRSGRIAAIHAGLCRKDEYEADITAVLDER
jgi:cytochrome c biogenesis protein CcmG/thiol:disulfide interchange protein DsbE